MKRLCIFAHWDKDNVIDDYVLYYLKALKEICSDIIFVSDTTTKDTGKLLNLTTYNIIEKHGEYDFGSYKRGLEYAIKNHLVYEELIFANDSCYGPFFDLKKIFVKMNIKDCDFWSLTKNRYGIKKVNGQYKSTVEPHLQSFFLVFKPQVFNDPDFINFIKNVKKETNKNDIIINYEIGLSKLLNHKKYTGKAYINAYTYIKNSTATKWDKLILKHKFPFIKTSLIKNGLPIEGELKNWETVIKKVSNYPTEIIKSNASRQLNLEPRTLENMNLYRKIRYLILKNFPDEIRSLVVILEKNCFKILNTLCFNKLNKF